MQSSFRSETDPAPLYDSSSVRWVWADLRTGMPNARRVRTPSSRAPRLFFSGLGFLDVSPTHLSKDVCVSCQLGDHLLQASVPLLRFLETFCLAGTLRTLLSCVKPFGLSFIRHLFVYANPGGQPG